MGADTTWQGGEFATEWNKSANWDAGVPNSTTDVIFGDVPSEQLLIDGDNASAGSILVEAGSSTFTINSAAAETLELYGDFTNNSAAAVNVNVYVSLKNSVTLSGTGGPLGSLGFYATTDAALTQTTLAGTVAIGGTLILGLDSAASYGNFTLSSVATLDLSGLTTIEFSPSSYTGALNDTFQLFDLSEGSWTGASEFAIDANSLPTLTGGLTWSTSSFETNGSISVVPEPGTGVLFLLAGAACWICSRRLRASP